MINFLIGISITIIVEFFVIFFFITKNYQEGLLFITLINLITFPIANYAYNFLLSNLIIIEIFVIIAELLLIKTMFRLKYSKSLCISLIANMITASISLFFI